MIQKTTYFHKQVVNYRLCGVSQNFSFKKMNLYFRLIKGVFTQRQYTYHHHPQC